MAVAVGGAASVKAEATEKLPLEPLRFRFAITLAGDGSNADKLPAGVKLPKNSAVIDSWPVDANDWSVRCTVDATNVPPWKDALKSLELTVANGATLTGTEKLPIVTAWPTGTPEKLPMPPCVVAFSTIKVLRVRSDCPVSFPPSAKLSEPVIGEALAALAQTTALAANASFEKCLMSRPYRR